MHKLFKSHLYNSNKIFKITPYYNNFYTLFLCYLLLLNQFKKLNYLLYIIYDDFYIKLFIGLNISLVNELCRKIEIHHCLKL